MLASDMRRGRVTDYRECLVDYGGVAEISARSGWSMEWPGWRRLDLQQQQVVAHAGGVGQVACCLAASC